MPPVVPDSGNAIRILTRIIERAVSDPQGFHFAFWSKKLTHRRQARVTYSAIDVRLQLVFVRLFWWQSPIG